LLLHSTRQRCQGRLQRATREVTRRESVYADFIMNASKSLLKDHISDEIKLDGEPQTLIGIAEEISAAAPPADRPGFALENLVDVFGGSRPKVGYIRPRGRRRVYPKRYPSI
jgi:hypothetical protein